MKKIMMLALSSVISWSTQAHVIWLERDHANAPTYALFGEYADRTSHADFLKGYSQLKFTHNQKSIPALAETQRLRFNTQGSGDTELSTQLVYEKTLVNFGARVGFATQKSGLDLDVVPVAGLVDQIQINFKGKPVPNAKLKLYGPTLWEKTYISDSSGQIQLEKPWQGQYLIEVSHEDKTAGQFNKVPYQQRYWVTTINFTH